MSHLNLIDTIVEVAEGLEGRPSWDEYFMATAFLIATRSACQRLNVGCVIDGWKDTSLAMYSLLLSGINLLQNLLQNFLQNFLHNSCNQTKRLGINLE